MLLRIFLTFMRIGAFTFGGGYAMLSLIQRDIVERYKWLTEEEFLDLFAVSQSLPGVFAVNMSIFIGYRLCGTLGAIIASLGTTLPSVGIILLLAMTFNQIQDNPIVIRLMLGIRPAVVAMIAIPVLTTWRSMRGTWRIVWLPILSALLVWAIGISPVWIILGSAIGGILYGCLMSRQNHRKQS